MLRPGEAAQRWRREISSERCRSERPPIVLLGAIRQWARILLTLTRPYFGTASSMSKTFAVSTYSGGFSSRAWIERRPALRSRFSCARLIRIWFALASASILWFSDRSGAIDVFVDVVLVAVAMGGESTHTKTAIKTKSANSSEAQLEVQACRALWTVWGAVCTPFCQPSDRVETFARCG